MGANRTGSQLRTAQGFNCFGSPWSEPASKSAASLQTVILHRWGVKCWFRNMGFITELSSLHNYHKPSSKTWRVGLLIQKCKLVQLALKSLDTFIICLIQASGYALPTNHLPYWERGLIFLHFLQVAQMVTNPSPGSERGASKAVLFLYINTSFRKSRWL